jgi:hypothetical protein
MNATIKCPECDRTITISTEDPIAAQVAENLMLQHVRQHHGRPTATPQFPRQTIRGLEV